MRNQKNTFLLVIENSLADLLYVHDDQRHRRRQSMAQANLVPRPQILRRPKQVPLHQALQKVEPETESAVVQASDGSVKGVLEPGLDEAKAGGGGADSVDAARRGVSKGEGKVMRVSKGDDVVMPTSTMTVAAFPRGFTAFLVEKTRPSPSYTSRRGDIAETMRRARPTTRIAAFSFHRRSSLLLPDA